MTVESRLLEIFRSVFANDHLVIHDSTTAGDVPGWDSLAHINLMFSIENEFGVRFTDDQLTGFADVGELRRFLESRTQVA